MRARSPGRTSSRALTHSHPGRVVWLVFNVLIAMLLMTLGVFERARARAGPLQQRRDRLGRRAGGRPGHQQAAGPEPAAHRVQARAPLRHQPGGPGRDAAWPRCWRMRGLCRRAGRSGRRPSRPSSRWPTALVAVAAARLARRAAATTSRAPTRTRWAPGQSWCTARSARTRFESEDMAHCPAYGAPICSLCCTLESRCHDRCKTDSRAAEQMRAGAAGAAAAARWPARVNFRVGALPAWSRPR